MLLERGRVGAGEELCARHRRKERGGSSAKKGVWLELGGGEEMVSRRRKKKLAKTGVL